MFAGLKETFLFLPVERKDMAKIMVVDDDEAIRFLIQKMLEKEGYEVVTASSGEECLHKVMTEKPDLILLDVMMPGLDGFDVCRILKEDEETGAITVAMVTVKSTDEDRLKSLEGCADWHITKPIEKKKFLEKVRWLLKYPPRRSLSEEE
jgi:DNA-binding response OmpR family regulator